MCTTRTYASLFDFWASVAVEYDKYDVPTIRKRVKIYYMYTQVPGFSSRFTVNGETSGPEYYAGCNPTIDPRGRKQSHTAGLYRSLDSGEPTNINTINGALLSTVTRPACPLDLAQISASPRRIPSVCLLRILFTNSWVNRIASVTATTTSSSSS